MQKHGSEAYLVNTGWVGGGYGVGERISIDHTRLCINSILDGSINSTEKHNHRIFNFAVPTYLPGLEHEICNPVAAWEDKDEYYQQANKLATMFQENFKKYTGDGLTDYTEFGPIVRA